MTAHGGTSPSVPFRRYLEAATGLSDLKKMLYMDTVTWLPDRLLLKADNMTMANSLELRVPSLDPKTKNRGYLEYGKSRGSLIDAWESKGEHPQEIFKLIVLELWHRSFVDSGNG